MPKKESRIPEKRREYTGEDDASALVNWLNHTQDVEGKERIMDLVRTFFQVELARAAVPRIGPVEDGELLHEAETEKTKERDELQTKLAVLLSFYTVVPSISFMTPMANWKGSDPPCLINWKAAPGSEYDKRQFPPFDESQDWKEEFNLPGMQMGEAGALRIALELFQSRFIWKIRRCTCGKFFFQRFSHQKFCSTACRMSAFRSSDEEREKRNRYARKLYQLRVSGAVK